MEGGFVEGQSRSKCTTTEGEMGERIDWEKD